MKPWTLILMVILTACGTGSETATQSSGQPVADQGGPVVCPKEGSQGKGLTGFGAALGDWLQAHPDRDSNHSAEFGKLLPDGRNEFTAECSKGGRVLWLTMNFDPPMSAASVITAVKDQLPADAKQILDQKQAKCELVVFKSPSLASSTGGEDPGGAAYASLSSPLTMASYDPASVDSVIMDAVDQAGYPSISC